MNPGTIKAAEPRPSHTRCMSARPCPSFPGLSLFTATEPLMSSPWFLGNDIVDLADPRHRGKVRERRFLDRVFTPKEQRDIGSSSEPDRALWIRWAGKEAAFKTVSKSLGNPPTFVHTNFQVTILEPDRLSSNGGTPTTPPMSRFGQVAHGGVFYPLRIEVAGSALHAVTWAPSSDGLVPPFRWSSERIGDVVGNWRKTLRPRFSDDEWECVSHRPSALARIRARRSIAEALGLDEADVEIRCRDGSPGRRIFVVFHQGKALPVDLTLSHHGGLLAWAFLSSPAG